LEDEELDAARPLLAAEGWEFELEELDRLRALGGAVGAYDGGELVGFLTFLDHEPERWIGNVVVAPRARGAGLAARLVGNALEGAQNAGLYSVEKAVSLYERLGFQPRGEAWSLRAEQSTPKRRATAVRPLLTASDSAGVLKLDKEATGMDRAKMLVALSRAFPENVRVLHERNRVVAYGIAKTSPTVTELGPIVAGSPQQRDAILDGLLQIAPAPFEITVLGAPGAAIEALEARGFQRRFRTIPMFRGKPPSWRPAMLVAAAGLEKG
jgi:GNAT superfamily N-acetyltransferase